MASVPSSAPLRAPAGIASFAATYSTPAGPTPAGVIVAEIADREEKSMTMTNQDIALYKGESRLLFVEIDLADGQPFDPEGSTLQWWVGKSTSAIANGDVVIKKALGTGINLVTGGIEIELLAEDTADLVPNYYAHQLAIFGPAGDVSIALVGTMVLRPSMDMRSRPALQTGAASAHGSGRVT
jgi:hypothetical protein